ncbi:tellurite resistance TerB family protein [Wenxinia marina]|uniref:Tellurite resistance protein TerB n=1 Tax=Wenxinia marina DSM 24838 TaxID=1123501 RepID=A0A0D0PYE8_9RHOB|nr:tellurite resistance TerB family protein [Wenxinia marina]KIQ67454.1 Tellurite resistance protein TerB [Wenxinia marina DSM 24838]GGL69403.1 2-dehydro-3-deoxyphosphooctonate aldolase [Wenxinia marina]
MSDTPSLEPTDALIALMIAVSASDEDIRTAELVTITNIVNNLPVFADYDTAHIPTMSRLVFDLYAQEDGLDALFDLIRTALPRRLWETAYAMACDVAAADGRIEGAEARMLEEIRHELEIDRLHAAAIERGARARYQRL